MYDFLILEISYRMVEILYGVLDKLFALFSVDKAPLSVGPVFDVVDPAVGDEPQITVREEFFGHLLDFGVVGDFLFEEVLPGVVLFGIGDGVL